MPLANLKTCSVQYSDLASSTGTAFNHWKDKPLKTLVFVHALGSSQNSFFPVLSHLRPGYRCILLDLPNSARSSRVKEGETTLEFLAETVFGLLDHLRVAGEVTIVGHGMGCLVALKAAEMFGERVGGLVLLSPVYPSKELEEILEQRIMTAWMGGMEAMASTIPNSVGLKATSLHKAFVRELLMGQDVEGYSAMCKCVAGARLPTIQVEVRGKVLVISGEEDVAAELCEKFMKAVRAKSGISRHLLDGVGRWVILEAPEEVAAWIRGWLEN